MTEPILTPFLGSQDITVYQGDCIAVMARMPEASVDAIITDPPYGLGFMGKDWDTAKQLASTPPSATADTPLGRFRLGKGPSAVAFDGIAFQAWTQEWALEALRILKPGGHLLAFGGTRTYHRLAVGIEDAGFEIRDCLAWLYGSGFPKSLDVSKAIDKAAGAERTRIGNGASHCPGIASGGDCDCAERNGEERSQSRPTVHAPATAPATPGAEKWQGWGTALKPAFEPIVLARKPLIGTVAANVLEHGTGALNIDGCRIAGDMSSGVWHGTTKKVGFEGGWDSTKKPNTEPHTAGRWPANVTLDEDAAAMLDEQTGDVSYNPSGVFGKQRGDQPKDTPAAFAVRSDGDGVFGYGDRGGASRFFYCAKASKKDRNTNGAANTHPTVKPTALMRWLIRLATPPGGIILDPFGGSGSTGVAARAEGVRAILIEREDEYLDIIRQRLDEGPLFENLD